MKKLLMGMMIIGALTACGTKDDKTTTKGSDTITIGISQIVEHPSLDAIRQGVEDAVKESEYGLKVKFDFQNAQGDFATAQTIADQFNRGSDIIVAITTPSAQAAQNKITDKPVFFTGVTNPVAAGLNADNVTGVSDMSPVADQVRLIKELLPNVKTVGTIYNTSEANSVFLTEKFTEAANEEGLEVVARGVSSVSEVASAMDSLSRVDAIYTTKDNTVASAYALIVNKADEAGIPVIGATRDFASMGALASAGTSEYNAGYQTGEMIVRYLGGEMIEDMPTEFVENVEVVLNSEKSEKFGLNIDEIIKNNSDMEVIR